MSSISKAARGPLATHPAAEHAAEQVLGNQDLAEPIVAKLDTASIRNARVASKALLKAGNTQAIWRALAAAKRPHAGGPKASAQVPELKQWTLRSATVDRTLAQAPDFKAALRQLSPQESHGLSWSMTSRKQGYSLASLGEAEPNPQGWDLPPQRDRKGSPQKRGFKVTVANGTGVRVAVPTQLYAPTGVALGPDGMRWVIHTHEKVELYDVSQPQATLLLTDTMPPSAVAGKGDKVSQAAWFADGSRLAALVNYGADSSSVNIYDATHPNDEIVVLAPNLGLSRHASFMVPAPRGNQLALAMENRLALFTCEPGVDPGDPHELSSDTDDSFQADQLSWSPDGRYIAAAREGTPVNSPKGLAQVDSGLRDYMARFWTEASDDEGPSLPTLSHGPRVEIWDTQSGHKLPSIALPEVSQASRLAFSKDSSKIYVGNRDSVHEIDLAPHFAASNRS